MAINEYIFISEWKVKSGIQEVYDVIGGDAHDLARWWPSVYLDVKVHEPGDVNGVGKIVELYTKGWLPYTLRWKFEITETNEPHGFSLKTLGDFVGTGVWTFKQNAEFTDIVYDWRIRAEKGILKNLSFLLKPVFAANHQWAMKKGYESLLLELERRKVQDPEQLKNIPSPPLPSFPHNFTNNKIL
jgi:hypothetical protein